MLSFEWSVEELSECGRLSKFKEKRAAESRSCSKVEQSSREKAREEEEDDQTKRKARNYCRFFKSSPKFQMLRR